MAATDRLAELQNRRCVPVPPGGAALSEQRIVELMGALDGWVRAGGAIQKRFDFGNFHETMAFVNAVAWVAHRQDHHPDLHVGYNRCVVRYSTHSVGGLSENDFICAAHIEGLLAK
jgi:4a-hydroxytetrahydrobiopterin dehydratase